MVPVNWSRPQVAIILIILSISCCFSSVGSLSGRHFLFLLVAALVHDGQKSDLTSEEDEWNVAEEDQQEQASKKDRCDSFILLDILEDRWLNIFLAEILDRDQ